MSLDLPTSLVREALVLLATLASPFMVALIGVGLVFGVAQAMTQVHDSAVGFVPRLLSVIGLMLLLGGEILNRLATFFADSVVRMAGGAP